MGSKSFGIIIIILLVIGTGIVGYIKGWFSWMDLEREGWVLYEDKDIGFSLEYPQELRVEKTHEEGVYFSLWGPTQIENSEFFDGISILVRREKYPENLSLKSFAERDADEIKRIGTITKPVHELKISDYDGYGYTANAIGVFEDIYIPREDEDREYLFISLSVPDPQNQGYSERADEILSTLRLIDREIEKGDSCKHVIYDYPTREIYSGSVHAPDFSTKPEARTFRTLITEGAKNGPNFAGNYTIVTWGCGSGCQSSAILDARTGKFIEYGLISTEGLLYRLHNDLLTLNPRNQGLAASGSLKTEYYVMKNGILESLCKKRTEEVCIQVITKAQNPITKEMKEFPTPCDVPGGWQVVR